MKSLIASSSQTGNTRMGIPIIPFTITLDRLKSLLAHQVLTLNEAG